MSTLREKMLNASSRPEKRLTVKIGDEDQAVLIMAPTVKQRNQIASDVDASGKKLTGDKIGRFQTKAVILCALDPETKKPIFAPQDEESLLEMPAGGWVDTIANAVAEFMQGEEESGKEAVGVDGKGPTEPNSP